MNETVEARMYVPTDYEALDAFERTALENWAAESPAAASWDAVTLAGPPDDYYRDYGEEVGDDDA
jgi:hypothetical protein